MQSKTLVKILVGSLIFIIPLGLLSIGDKGTLAARYRSSRRTTGVQKITPPSKNYFYWGAKMTPSATTLSGTSGIYEGFDEAINDQLEFGKELGLNIVKATWEARSDKIDNFVNWAKARGFKVVIQLEDPEMTDFWSQATHERARELGKKVASRYYGQVDFYQLGNEINGAVIKPGGIGKDKGDYDPWKWGIMKNWLLGLTQGIHEGDPFAKKIITFNWKGTGIIDLIREANIHFDIIGVNWYSDMGDPFQSFDINRKYWSNMFEYLWDKHRIDIWVSEANQHKGTYDASTQGQADSIRGFADAAFNSPFIKAFMVYQMSDTINQRGTETGHYGIVWLRYDNRWKVMDRKPAFSAFQGVISTHPGFPK